MMLEIAHKKAAARASHSYDIVISKHYIEWTNYAVKITPQLDPSE
jgi:hypothetical protein